MEIKANALIIIDPQNDFVKGSLAVPGAEEAMNNIIKFIEDHKQDLGYIAVTLDWHPLSHCSFKEFGGSWPPHCVQYSEGAAVYEPLMKAIIDSDIPVEFWTKGELLLEEEYSILESGNEYPFCDELSERTTINIDKEQFGEIYVAGLAGDYCVYHTLKDLIESDFGFSDWLHVVSKGVASIDDGTTLSNLCYEYEIPMI